MTQTGMLRCVGADVETELAFLIMSLECRSHLKDCGQVHGQLQGEPHDHKETIDRQSR